MGVLGLLDICADILIAKYDGSDTLLRKFIYGPGIDEPICMIDVDGQTETRYYYHYDGLGSVVALSNVNGDIVEAYSYDVFGTPTIYTAAGADGLWRTGDDTTASVSAIGSPYMFTGRRYDDETGLYYYRARMYAPDLGRFMQTDPIGYADGINWYAYCDNNPIIFSDALGLCKENNNFNPKLFDDYFGWFENIWLFLEFEYGFGPEVRNYGPGSYRTQSIKNSSGILRARDKFYEMNASNIANGEPLEKYGPKFYDWIVDGGPFNPFVVGTDPTLQFTGSFEVTITPNDNGTLTYEVMNSTDVASFTKHNRYINKIGKTIFKNQTFWDKNFVQYDPWSREVNKEFGTTVQNYTWNEPIKR